MDYRKITLEPHKKEIEVEKQTYNDWDLYIHKETMMTSKELDTLTSKLDVKHLPEMFFGSNIFYFVNPSLNFAYEINPIEMINLCSYKDRKVKKDEKKIYYTPNEEKVQYHNEWKNMKIERDDIQKLDPTEDWTFTSTYMGSIKCIKDTFLNNIYNKSDKKDFKVEVDENVKIPYEKLGPDNPIKVYLELPFYEDELNDNGICEGKLRFRVMGDSFFGLLRCYLRVDNVIVRNVDTRIYHEFGKDYIIRNFIVKEATYSQLEKNGLNLQSSWALSPNQSDEIARFMGDPVFNITDKIFLK